MRQRLMILRRATRARAARAIRAAAAPVTVGAAEAAEGSDVRLLGAALLAATLAVAAPNENCVIAVSKAIARAEGIGKKGSIAQRQNNPGCLRRVNGEYLSFPTPEAGRGALYATVRSKLRRIGLGMLDRWSETPGYFEVIRGYAGKNWVACEQEKGFR